MHYKIKCVTYILYIHLATFLRHILINILKLHFLCTLCYPIFWVHFVSTFQSYIDDVHLDGFLIYILRPAFQMYIENAVCLWYLLYIHFVSTFQSYIYDVHLHGFLIYILRPALQMYIENAVFLWYLLHIYFFSTFLMYIFSLHLYLTFFWYIFC